MATPMAQLPPPARRAPARPPRPPAPSLPGVVEHPSREHGRAPRWAFLAALLVVALPLVVTALVAPARDRLQAVSTLVGVLAVAVMVCALVLPCRVRRLTRALGIDRVLRWHRLLGTSVVVLVVVHVVLAVADDPRGLALLDPFDTTTASSGAPLSRWRFRKCVAAVLTPVRQSKQTRTFRGASTATIASGAGAFVSPG